jgi:septal ring factor EnvC (AmiA/AmiB activator)
VEAADLRAELAVLAAARAAVAAEQPRLAAARAAQAAQSQALDRQIEAAQANRQAALDAGEQAARQAAEQAARAENLRAVIAEIEANRRAAEARARDEAARATRARHTEVAADARRRQVALASPTGAGTIAASAQPSGQLITPVAGNLTRNWGDSTEAGPATGLTWRPAPGARVLAPCSGKVMFAAPFRSFGLLMIVDCGGGHHVVLSGLERLDTAPGRALHAGEPVGTMGNWDPTSPGPRPALYLELRRDGRPVNPVPWLRGHG